MSTISAHERWASRLADTKVWVEEHGRLPRTTVNSGAHERALHVWVIEQRARHKAGLLPDRYIEALREVGGILDIHPITPRQQDLKDWVRAHGRRPESRSSDPEEAKLGSMVYTLRRCGLQGKLKPGAVEVLLSVPGVLDDAGKELVLSRLGAKLEARRSAGGNQLAGTDTRDARWNRSFDELSAWVAEHGSLPRRRATGKEQQIANWLNVQRMQERKGNLLPEYGARLRAFPGALEPQRVRTAAQTAADVAAFRAEHGRLPSSVAERGSAERSLYHSMSNCLRRGTLTRESLGRP